MRGKAGRAYELRCGTGWQVWPPDLDRSRDDRSPNVADVLAERFTFEDKCIDRMFPNVYVPQLQYPRGLVGYVHKELGLPIASMAPLAKITDKFVAAVHRFATGEHCLGGLRQG